MWGLYEYLRMVIEKKCACGNVWRDVPAHAVKNSTGFWWQCPCKSTMFVDRLVCSDVRLIDYFYLDSDLRYKGLPKNKGGSRD